MRERLWVQAASLPPTRLALRDAHWPCPHSPPHQAAPVLLQPGRGACMVKDNGRCRPQPLRNGARAGPHAAVPVDVIHLSYL